RALQRHVGIEPAIVEGLVLGLGLDARDLGFEARHLRGQGAEIGPAKVGSSFAKTSPARTCWPSRTSIERTIAVSSGCTNIVAAFEIATPCTLTTWSTGISPIVAIITITRLVMTHTVPRAERGIGALTIAVDGHWNSRIAGKVGSAPPRRLTTSALDEDLLMTKDLPRRHGDHGEGSIKAQTGEAHLLTSRC